jgi:hypothetical protein
VGLEHVPGQGLGEVGDEVERQDGLRVVDDGLGRFRGTLSWHF